MLDKVTAIIRRQEWLENNRCNFVNQWREVNYRVCPTPDYFYGVTPIPGEKNTERLFDSTASLALGKFVSALDSSLTPQTQRWHKLSTSMPALNDMHEVQLYLDQVTDILFAARYSPASNFANQIHEVYMSLGKYGTGGLFIGDDYGKGIQYKSIHISELFIAENDVGAIDTVFRKFQYTAAQAADAFGYDKLPDKIKNKLEKTPDEKFWFIHAVLPNKEYNPSYKDYRGMAFSSCYICFDTKDLISEGGYRTMPYAVSRYRTNTNEIYGRSPAMDVLPDIKMLNEMEKTNIRSAQRLVDPPLLLQEDGALSAFSMKPGALNYGGVDADGRPVVMPLQTGSRVDIGLEVLNQKRELINEAFLITLFQILVETPQMTATEAMYRQQEKAALLAPTIGRQQSELLGPLIERELDILAAAGVLPPMPDVLAQYNGEIKIEYMGPFSRAQKSDEGIGIMNTLQAVASMAQFDPSVIKIINTQEAVRILSQINGAPERILRSEEEVAAMDQAEAQQQQLQQILQAAPVAAQTSKTLAEAQSIAGSPAPQIAGVA